MAFVGLAAILGTLASAPGVSVDAAGCPDVSGERVGQLVVVEHPELADSEGLSVTLTCRDALVTIAVRDEVTDKTVTREIETAPVASVEREREIALATSSLIVASWMELFVPREQRHPPPPPPSEATHVATSVVADAVRAEPVASLQVATGVRWRSLPDALAVLHLGLLAGGFVHRHWEVRGNVGFEIGRADRSRGQVDLAGVSLGPSVAWHLRPEARVSLEVVGGIAVGYAWLVGRTGRSEIAAGAVSSATGEVELGLGPRFRARSFVLALDAMTGWAIPTPRGIVTNEPVVTPGGFWVGVGLRVGALLGRAVTR